MRTITRMAAAIAVAFMLAVVPWTVHHGTQAANAAATTTASHGAAPRPYARATANLATGCNTTVTDLPTNFSGWHWRTTQEVCNDPGNQYDCLTVDKVNPAAIPPVVNVMPKQCIYPRLR